MPASALQYDLSHRLLLEINAFLGGEPPPHRNAGAKLTFSEFFAICASKSGEAPQLAASGDASQLVAVTPFPDHLAEQCGFG